MKTAMKKPVKSFPEEGSAEAPEEETFDEELDEETSKKL